MAGAIVAVDVVGSEQASAAAPAARRARLFSRALPFLVFPGLSLLMYRPTPGRLSSALYGDIGDPSYFTWALLWDVHAAFTDPFGVFNAPIFWPNDLALAYTDPLLPLAVGFAPLHLLSGNEVLSFNLLTLAFSVFSQVATYLLARRITGRRDVAVLAAVAYAFSSYVFAHIGHIHLLTLGWFPVCFLLLFKLLAERRTSVAVALGACSATLFLSALYYGAVYLVCVTAILAAYLVLERFRVDRALLGRLLLAGGVAAVLLVPFLVPYRQVQDDLPDRGLDDAYGLDLPDLFTPHVNSVIYDDLADSALNRDDPVEHSFFLGFSTVILAFTGGGALVAAAVRRRRQLPGPEDAPEPGGRRRVAPLAGALAVAVAGAAGFVLALGPNVHGVPAPFRLFHEFVPGFASMRAMARLAIPGLLAVSVLAAWGLARLTDRLERRGRSVVVGLVVALLVAELSVTSVPNGVLQRDRATLAAYEELDRRPPGAVVELPVVDVTDPTGLPWASEAPRLVYATRDWNPRFNGYSSWFPLDYVANLQTLNTFPSPASIALARRLEIRYVLLHVGNVNYWPQLTEDEADAMVAALPADVTAARYGRTWLVDLAGEPRRP